MMDNEAINRARAVHYGLFASLFIFFDDQSKFQELLKTVEVLKQNPLDSHTEAALSNMYTMLNEGGLEALKEENSILFFNPYASFIPITASFYDEQRDDGKKRLEMVNYVLSSKFRRDTDKFKELEDHVGFILLFMQKLIADAMQGDKASQDLSLEVFTHILNGFIDEFIENVYTHTNSQFYKEVAIVFQAFLEMERFFLGVAKPIKVEKRKIEALEKKQKKPLTQKAKRNLDEIVL
ncbi:MAG: molecular chaperone TorD family protein [Sulfurospirillaceae bacterium]|nr:molecular chaperone TorD family protein [Sulfurospirillaceae bacterium]